MDRIYSLLRYREGFPSGSDGKASVYNVEDPGLILGSGRSPGEGNGTPLQYYCLENPMDGGAWQATVHGVAKSWTRLSEFTFTFTLEMCSLTTTGFIKLENECFCVMLIHRTKVYYIIFNCLILVPFICLCYLYGPCARLSLRHEKVSLYVLGEERWDAQIKASLIGFAVHYRIMLRSSYQ